MKPETVAVTLAVALSALVARADVVTESHSGLQAWVPDQWVQTLDDETLTVAAPDGQARVIFEARAAADLAQGWVLMDDVLGARVHQPLTTHEPQEVALDGLAGRLRSGTGSVGDDAVYWTVGGFFHDGHVLFVVVIAHQTTFMPHQNDLSLVMQSVSERADPDRPFTHQH